VAASLPCALAYLVLLNTYSMKYLLAFVLTCCALCAQDKTPLNFGSIGLFDDHRKNVCSAYLKASSPIYNKGDAATDEEKKAFTVAALELVRLQAYIGKVRRLTLSSKSNEATRDLEKEKLNEAYAKMAAAKIKTDLPATRAELNEASKYINALGQIMQLPVALGGKSKK
jgi:hypothetical protein